MASSQLSNFIIEAAKELASRVQGHYMNQHLDEKLASPKEDDIEFDESEPAAPGLTMEQLDADLDQMEAERKEYFQVADNLNRWGQ